MTSYKSLQVAAFPLHARRPLRARPGEPSARIRQISCRFCPRRESLTGHRCSCRSDGLASTRGGPRHRSRRRQLPHCCRGVGDDPGPYEEPTFIIHYRDWAFHKAIRRRRPTAVQAPRGHAPAIRPQRQARRTRACPRRLPAAARAAPPATPRPAPAPGPADATAPPAAAPPPQSAA